jgi:hypothetical protein
MIRALHNPRRRWVLIALKFLAASNVQSWKGGNPTP